MRDHITIYIGYYRNTILAVSPDKKILKHYLKETRKLSPNEYTIRDSYMASENIYALYEDYLLPQDGVYIGQIKIFDKIYNAMLNVGKHPTIDKLNDSIIEAHIIDFNENIYNEHVSIIFLEFLREEKTFASFGDLKKELELNKKTIINYFKK